MNINDGNKFEWEKFSLEVIEKFGARNLLPVE